MALDLAAAASAGQTATAVPVTDTGSLGGVTSFDSARDSLVNDTDSGGEYQDVNQAERLDENGEAVEEFDAAVAPVADGVPGAQVTNANVSAGMKLGNHTLNAEQAAKLQKILDEAGGFDLVDATWTERNRIFESITGAVQRHRDESVAIRKQAMQALSGIEAREKAVQELMKQMGGGQAQAQGTPTQNTAAAVPNLDPNDPFHAPLIPLYQSIQAMQQKFDAMQNHRDPYTSHQIAAGFESLRESVGAKFPDYLKSVAENAQIELKANPITGEPDLSSLDPSQALVLQQGMMKHTNDVKKYGAIQDQWFADAISKTHFLKHSKRNQDAFWAQIAEDYGNGKPVDQNSFVRLALEIDQGIRQDNDAIGAQQAKLRSEAGQPLVSHGGTGRTPTQEQNGINLYNKDGKVSMDAIRDQLIAKSRLSRRKG